MSMVQDVGKFEGNRLGVLSCKIMF